MLDDGKATHVLIESNELYTENTIIFFKNLLMFL